MSWLFTYAVEIYSVHHMQDIFAKNTILHCEYFYDFVSNIVARKTKLSVFIRVFHKWAVEMQKRLYQKYILLSVEIMPACPPNVVVNVNHLKRFQR